MRVWIVKLIVDFDFYKTEANEKLQAKYDLCFKRATLTGTLFDKDLFHLCVQVQLVDVDSLVPGNGKMVMIF